MTLASGGTNIAGALNFMKNVAFTLSNGNRCDAHKLGVVISDGYSDVPITATAALQAKEAGIELFAIGNYLFSN